MSALRFQPQLATLPVYVPGRPIEETAREVGLEPGEIIKLASNENPFGPSPRALDAVLRAAVQCHLYPDGGSNRLKTALAAKLALAPSQILLGNGSNEILELVGHTFLGPGDEALVSEHCFAVYPIVAALFGARLVAAPDRALAPDIDALIARITDRTRVIFLANPNNPTGSLTPDAGVERLLALAPPSTLVVIDEAYIEFLERPMDLLPRLRSGVQPNLLIARTFSKVYGLAGVRVGYGLAGRDVVAAMERARQPFNLNALAQAAALAALDDENHVRRTVENNTRERARLEAALEIMGCRCAPSHANFVLTRVGDGARVCQKLLRRGVIVRPMDSYALPEWIRVSVGLPAENSRFLAALEQAIAA